MYLLLMQSLLLSFNTHVIPLWPAINTSVLEFHLSRTSNYYQICFAIELTGCSSNNGKCIAIAM